MHEVAESAFGGDLEPVSRWVNIRCWVLHWFLHRKEEDSGVVVRFCPRCSLVLRVAYPNQGDTDAN